VSGPRARAGRKFATASAFSIHCKRLQTPGKQGDDGWKSVLYEGQPLERFRRRLAAARAAAPPARAAPAGAPDADEVRRSTRAGARSPIGYRDRVPNPDAVRRPARRWLMELRPAGPCTGAPGGRRMTTGWPKHH